MRYLNIRFCSTIKRLCINYIYFLLITVTNFWFWQILIDSPLIFCLLIIIEFGLFILCIQEKSEIKRTIFFLILFFVVVVGYIVLKNNFDNTLLTSSPLETRVRNERHGLLANGLGILFTNKYSQRYYVMFSLGKEKYLRNIFYSLDPNLYFFRSHPREKAGIDEYDKYSPFILPIFIMGMLFLIINYRKYQFLITYLVISMLITGFVSQEYRNGPLLFFPLINIILYFGLVFFIQKYHSLVWKPDKYEI